MARGSPGTSGPLLRKVEEGETLIVQRDGQPMAVMLAFGEAQRWQQIEQSLSPLRGLEIYPELARDTAELARIVRPREPAIRHRDPALGDQSRDILARSGP